MTKGVVLLMSKIKLPEINILDNPKIDLFGQNRHACHLDRMNMQKYHNKIKCGKKMK